MQAAPSSTPEPRPRALASTKSAAASTQWNGHPNTSTSGSSRATAFPPRSTTTNPTSRRSANQWPTCAAATSTASSTTTPSSSTRLSAAPGPARPLPATAALLRLVSSMSPTTLRTSRKLSGLLITCACTRSRRAQRQSATLSGVTRDRLTVMDSFNPSLLGTFLLLPFLFFSFLSFFTDGHAGHVSSPTLHPLP